MAEKKTLLFNGKKISYTDAGKGNVLVFLHGFLETKKIWEGFSDFLSGEFRVICMDLPGHGETEVFGEVHSMPLMADCVNEVIKHEKISGVFLTGHSMGGYAALSFAGRYGEKLKGLCLFNSTAYADSELKKRDRDRAIQVMKKNPLVFINEAIPNLFSAVHLEKYRYEIEAAKQMAASIPLEGVCACLRGMKEREDKTGWLKQTKIPVLFIAGDQDNVIPLEKALEQVQLSEKIKPVILRNCGHMGFIEAGEESRKALYDFVKKVAFTG